MRFDEKIVLITGGSGGIGKAAARRFASEGAKVVISDVNDTDLNAVRIDFKKDGLAIRGFAADLRKQSECVGLVSSVMEAYGRIDVLINNAGYMVRGDITATSDDMWFDSFAVNVHAVFYLSREVVPHMKTAGDGVIINTSSAWGVHPAANHLAYNTTKGCVAVMTKNLARDCAPHGIRVNAVCPNEVNTPMLKSGFLIRGFEPDEAIEQLNKTVPIGRIAEPEEIASVMAFLASRDAGYMCGALVEVTGAKAVY